MKLLRIKLPDDLEEPFRSLQPGFEINFYPNLKSEVIEPIGLAGLNGSGKSNLLELISEIFYYLDSLNLDFPSQSVKEEKKFGFEIDYALPVSPSSPPVQDNDLEYSLNDRYVVIRVIKTVDGELMYMVTILPDYNKERLSRGNRELQGDEDDEYIANWVHVVKEHENIRHYLPDKILAYTSGHNEQLSNCYYKMRFHYFNDYCNRISDGQTAFYIDSSRLFFCDNNTHASIFIANNLLADKEALKKLNTVVGITELHSFRITIRFTDISGEPIKFNQDLQKKIRLLKNCATTWYEKGEGPDKSLTLDYLVDDATRTAFNTLLSDSPFGLYKIFYELEMQNFYTLPDDVLQMAIDGPKWLNVGDELPRQNPNDLIFRIENVNVKKHDIKKPVKYKGLSDGEHQFLQVVGMILMMEEDACLFLLDEPDTHYNPIWRSKLIQTINSIVGNDKEISKDHIRRLQEIVITTHSPFVLSDLKKRNVYVFEKLNNIVLFKQSPIETYGAAASIILDIIFGKENSISEMAKSELSKMAEGIDTEDKLMDAVQRLNTEFGESVEKFDMFNKLRNIKEELKKKSTR